MKRIIFFMFIVLFSVTAQQALANEAGDVGSEACLTVQQDAQATVLAGDAYKNHGQMVRVAAYITGSAVDAEEITEGCASCIVSQFARRVDVAVQEPCGEIQPGGCPCFTAAEVDIILDDSRCDKTRMDVEVECRDQTAPPSSSDSALIMCWVASGGNNIVEIHLESSIFDPDDPSRRYCIKFDRGETNLRIDGLTDDEQAECQEILRDWQTVNLCTTGP